MQMVSNYLLLRYDDVMILSEEDNGDENEGIEVNRLQPVICSTASDVSNDILVQGCYPIWKKKLIPTIQIIISELDSNISSWQVLK